IQELTLTKGVALDRPVSRIERSIARCDQLVTGLLDYTRPAVLNCKPTDIDTWLDTILDEQTIPPRILLERHFCAPDCVVDLDPDRFRRVVINLIDNATQAIEQGDEASGSARHRISVGTRAGDQLQ